MSVKVATHNSVFHGDDIVACALLTIAHHSVEVIRTRDMNEMSTCDYIVDVGRRRETCGDQLWIDHHQDVTSYSNGVKRAACGYVFDYLLEKGLLQFSEKEAAEFRTVVKTFDTNKDNSLSAAEIAAVTTINCSEKGIASLKGVEHFTGLKRLYCWSNDLTSLNVSGCTALIRLECYSNQLTSLDLSNCPELEDENIQCDEGVTIIRS